MIFCLGEGKYETKGAGYQKNLQIFNTPVSEEVYNSTKSALSIKGFKPPIAKWIDIKDIEKPTDTQKTLGGYLKTLSYKDAWAEIWAGLSQEDRNFFKTLPHFSSEIFEGITGIKIEDNNLSGQEVEVKLNGVVYKAIIKNK